MLCASCGSQITEGGRFCTSCGTAQTPASGNQDPLIGRTIAERYRLDSKLGFGGMGSIYSATRLHIGDTVAVKILHSELVSDSLSVERFRREAQAAARLKHPNAVAIYDFGVSTEGLVYIVMELVEGQSLRDVIKQEGPFTAPAAVEVLNQVCSAVDEAHRHNIVHRDLKPDNIMVSVTASGLHIKVLDFGIAKLRDLSGAAGTLTQSGAIMGSPHYMSPEQCLGEELDGRSDIYSLGVVLYEMLTRRLPFNSPTSTALVVQHVTQPPPSLRAINVSLSPAVEAVALHALEKRREARPQTAAAFAQELAAAATGATVITQGALWPAQTALHSAPPTPPMTTPGWVTTGRTATPTSGAVTLSGTPPFPSGAALPAKSHTKLVLLLVGAVLVIALIGGAVAWLIYIKTGENRTQPGKSQAEATNSQAAEQPDREPDNPASNPTPPVATNSVPPTNMVYVPGGEFLMGSDKGDEYERPRHEVKVKPFFIDRYEVTCDEYEEFIRATGHTAPPGWINAHHPPGKARSPVTGASWDDANAYARWAGKRLPTEEEWEFAARGTDGRRYPWGSEWKSRMANADTSAHGHGGTAEVGEHKGSSPFGAFDMAGNAWEWTATDFATYPGGQSATPPQNEQKVVRGGSWKSNKNQATTTFRIGMAGRGGSEYSDIGFRCAKDV